MFEKRHFSYGLVVGLLLGALFFHFFAPRFSTTTLSSGSLIKLDKWSGESWRFVDNQWKKNMDVDQQWEQIDQALEEALNINTTGKGTTVNALELLKSKYPILKDITDEELNERIKIVYSKAIMNDLYLSNFLKLHNEKSELNKKTEPGRPVGAE